MRAGSLWALVHESGGRRQLTEWKRRFHPSDQSEANAPSLSDADRQALEALGYVDSPSE
jgi:hypothetical protein